MTISYLNTAINPPPLNVKLIVRKSKWVFCGGAKVVFLNSDHASDIQWHVDDLMNDSYDQWAFVNPDDELEYNNAITVTVKGVKHEFKEDGLTSAAQMAILFLKKLDEEEREF
jgi:hypothetical protein